VRDDIRIYCPLDFRDLPIRPGSVDLVMTDPMYHHNKLHLWSEVAEWSARMLKDGGVFFAFTGTRFLNEVLKRVDEDLAYQDLFFVDFAAPTKSWRANKYARLKYTKAALLYAKGEWRSPKFIKDRFPSRWYRPKYHKWQLPLDAVMYWMERLTERGDLVVDPFGGSWTTGIAARRLHRRYVGSDVDPACRAIWQQRLTAGD
jgi:DNA modification methylase